MTSPYLPPVADCAGEALALPALRWTGAAIFAAVPALFMVVAQADYLYRFQEYQSAQDWAQVFYTLPVVVFAALAGYAAARRCARASLLGLLPLAAASGCVIALGGVITMSVVMPLLGSKLQPFALLAIFFLRATAVFVPLAAIQCAVTRFCARKQGFVR